MSWDVSIINLGDFASLQDIPDDFEPKPIGTLDTVLATIRDTFPSIAFERTGWGVFAADDWSIEFNTLKDDPVDSFMLHVRGGEGAVPAILTLIDALGVRAIDCSSGEFLDEDVGKEGFAKWRAYRDQVAKLYE